MRCPHRDGCMFKHVDVVCPEYLDSKLTSCSCSKKDRKKYSHDYRHVDLDKFCVEYQHSKRCKFSKKCKFIHIRLDSYDMKYMREMKERERKRTEIFWTFRKPIKSFAITEYWTIPRPVTEFWTQDGFRFYPTEDGFIDSKKVKFSHEIKLRHEYGYYVSRGTEIIERFEKRSKLFEMLYKLLPFIPLDILYIIIDDYSDYQIQCIDACYAQIAHGD